MDDSDSTVKVLLSKNGYLPVTLWNDKWLSPTIEMIPDQYSGDGGKAIGRICDALNVSASNPNHHIGIQGLTLYVRPGMYNSSEGAPIATLTTGKNGRYTLKNVKGGNYTILVVDERTGIKDEYRYKPGIFNVKVLGGKTIKKQKGYVSKSFSTRGFQLNSENDDEFYKVSFDSDGGSSVEPQTIEEDEPIIKPEDPTKEGFTFVGWYTRDEEDGTETEWNFDEDTVAEDTTLYAKWEEKEETEGGFNWDLTDGKLTIRGTGPMLPISDDIDEPSPLEWGKRKAEITEVVIEDGITDIRMYAFSGCENLTSITIPNSVVRIGYEAFSGCKSLTSITIPDSVTVIGGSAFEDCRGLTNITISGNIGSLAFWGCRNLESVTILNGTRTIGSNAFDECINLTNITLPESLTSIGGEAFSGCKSLTSLIIPDGVTSIRDWAFAGCESLTSITMPGDVTRIGEGTFVGCSSLTSVIIPVGVTYIGEDAFNRCTSLASVTIPDSVTQIANAAFKNCDMLAAAYYGGTESDWNKVSVGTDNEALLAVLSYHEVTIEWNLTDGRLTISGTGAMPNYKRWNAPWSAKGEEITEIVIEDGITSIGMYAFMYCENLTSITIPNSITSIEYGAFSYCSNLKSIVIPDGVTKIRDDTFVSCNSLTSIVIPDGVKSIGANAFNGSGLTSITIPNSVVDIRSGVFAKCEQLTDIYYGGSQEEWDAITIGTKNEELNAAAKHGSDGSTWK